MVELILFHHVLGLTEGVVGFAERLRSAGHRVTLPDLFDGTRFESIEEGVAHAERVGMDNLIAAGVAAAQGLPGEVVYGGFSLGAMAAHKLAQTRPGAVGALLYHHGDVPLDVFGLAWPARVDLQIHVNEDDEWCEMDIVEDFIDRAGTSARAELFTYPGSSHLFTDSSLPDYDADSAELVLERTLAFLERRS